MAMFGRVAGRLKDLTELFSRLDRLDRRMQHQRDQFDEALGALRAQVARLADGHRLDSDDVLAGRGWGIVPAADTTRFATETPGLCVLDVRTHPEWETGHVADAIHLPLEDLRDGSGGSGGSGGLSSHEVLHRLPNRTGPILAICSSGDRSAIAADLLVRHGYTGVYNAAGGMNAWTGATSSGTPVPAPAPGAGLVIIEESRAHRRTAPKPAVDGHLAVASVEQTPNPDARKFLLELSIPADAPRDYPTATDADGDPLARALFEIAGVASVYIARDFVSVTRGDAEWPDLELRIRAAIAAFPFTRASEGAAVGSAHSELTGNALLDRVNVVLDERIRPALAQDGGGLTVIGLDGHHLTIHYQGACGTCPSATQGTMMAIGRLLRAEVDERISVTSR